MEGERSPSTTPLGFAMVFAGGRAGLRLEGRLLPGGASVDELELDVPDLRFPFDLTGGVRRFATRRTDLRVLTLSCDEAALERYVRALEPERAGLADLRCRIEPQGVRLSGEGRGADRRARFTALARFAVDPARRLSVTVEAVRIYGWLPLPAWSLARALVGLLAPLAHAEPRANVDVLDLALMALLPPNGWRLPGRRAPRLREVVAQTDGRRALVLRFGPAPAGPPAEEGASAPEAAWRAWVDAEGGLARGELQAESVLDDLLRAPPEDVARLEAFLGLALALGPRDAFARARRFVEILLLRQPDDEAARLAEAIVAAETGARARARESFARLSEAMARADRRFDAEHAAAAAAQAMPVRAPAVAPPRDEPEPVPQQLERARALWQTGDFDAAETAFQRVARALNATPRDPAQHPWAAEAELRLAQCARLSGSVEEAARHLERGLREEPYGAPLPVVVDALEQAGQTHRLVNVLSRRLGAATGEERRQIALTLAAALERMGRSEDAVSLYEELLARNAHDVSVLAKLAELHRRDDRRPALLAALARLFAVIDREPTAATSVTVDREAVGLALAGLCVDDHPLLPYEPERAAAVLRRLLEHNPALREARTRLLALEAGRTQ